MLTGMSKASWGDGPWNHEPDEVRWWHLGLPCAVLRTDMGNFNGYVGVPPRHPWWERTYQNLEDSEAVVDVHGGLTFSGRPFEEPIPPLGGAESEDALVDMSLGRLVGWWWFGFDCAHAFDLQPGMVAMLRERYAGRGDDQADAVAYAYGRDGVYRDVNYVRAECEKLAARLCVEVHA
jgi:hypothetical protein